IWLHKSFEANPAPPLSASVWFNTERAPSLDDLHGRVIVLLAFQMLCPGCVLHGLPQAARIRSSFEPDDVAVIGVHATFEHDEPPSARALDTFLREYGIDVPIALDGPATGRHTLNITDASGFAGTPSMVLIDREGLVRAHVLGRPSDLRVGAALGHLLPAERPRPVVRTRPRLIKPVEPPASNDAWFESWSSNWGT